MLARSNHTSMSRKEKWSGLLAKEEKSAKNALVNIFEISK